MSRYSCFSRPFFLLFTLHASLLAQRPLEKASSTADVQQSLKLAETGHCAEALPSLKHEYPQLLDLKLKRQAGLAGVRCAMTLAQPDMASEFVSSLARDFSRDPEVLYTLVHAYSDLSSWAAQNLARYAPTSEQAHKLGAEAFEQQGKWDDAASEYRAILKQDPKTPGIHFRLARLLLSRPNPPADIAEQARKECQEELNIDPSNAGAEYVLGELARQNQHLDEAIEHFQRASKLDPEFGDAFLSLGESLMGLKKFSDAIPPLQTAVKLEPANPAAHYNLGTAYSRVGQKSEAEKEFAIHRQMTQKQDANSESQAPNPSTNPD